MVVPLATRLVMLKKAATLVISQMSRSEKPWSRRVWRWLSSTEALDVVSKAALLGLNDGDEAAYTDIAEVSAALKGWQNTARQLGMSAADIAAYSTAIQCD